MTIRFSLITIESDNADPAIMTAISELLERAGGSAVLVQPASPAALLVEVSKPEPAATVAPKHTSIARHLMDGSLQELVMEAVTQRPGASITDLAATVLNETTGSAKTRIGMAVSPLVLTGRLVRTTDGKLYTPAAAATLPVTEEAPRKRLGRPPGSKNQPPASAQPTVAPRECRQFPPCRNCRDGGGDCLSIAKAPTAVREEARASTRLDSETRTLEPAPAVQPFDVGHVGGVAAPAQAPGSLTDRIVQAVLAKPGTTQHELAVELLGEASTANVRRIDMLLGALVMSGKLARYNGRVYENVAQAAKLKLPPPGRTDGARRPGAGQAPLAQVKTQKDLFDAIVAAFTEDHATPIADLAREIMGESTGRSVDKLQLMLRQLCSSKRLKALGGGSYRPIGEDERPAESDDDGDEDNDEESDDEESDETESNGAPDDDALEELKL